MNSPNIGLCVCLPVSVSVLSSYVCAYFEIVFDGKLQYAIFLGNMARANGIPADSDDFMCIIYG